MSNLSVVDVLGRHAGLLVGLDEGVRFLASLPELYDLDEAVFPDRGAARRAIEARYAASRVPRAFAVDAGPSFDDRLQLAG